METNKSINRSDIQKNLYNALVEAYNSNKEHSLPHFFFYFFLVGTVVYIEKRGRADQDKDEDPSARSDRGTKRRKSSKDAEPSKGLNSKESKSSSSSRGTQSKPKSLGKSTQVEEPEFEAADTEIQKDQGNESGHLDDQPNNEVAPKHDCFQTLNKPPIPDRAWNKSKSIDSQPPQKWISTIAKARQPPRTFDELMDTPVGLPRFIFTELEYHFEECNKAVNDQLDWHNPEGREYMFDLGKPLLLIEDRGRQVVPTDYFINNDLEYLKGGSSSMKYVTSTTRTKAANVKVMRWYDYGYLEEIVIQKDDNVLYKFKEGDFPRLNLYDIEDMLLLLVQKKLSNLDVDDRYDLAYAMNNRTASNQATSANDSLKSIPYCWLVVCRLILHQSILSQNGESPAASLNHAESAMVLDVFGSVTTLTVVCEHTYLTICF
ncbi:hypothetical protein Tco_1485512 [Tanacetum coccineum]